MHDEMNEHNQPMGPKLSEWKEPPVPLRGTMFGRYCRLEALDPERPDPVGLPEALQKQVDAGRLAAPPNP